MSIDPEIQFGDLEEEQPDIELRPDRNAHYAVVAYGEPLEDELPIFVDLDTLIEMESHALTDTSVELGGVMLGGQLNDENGQAYVLVQDSVRAQHYEATKGSFKFTHDTWGQITRERDDFPDDWDMVGWYHTHPDWGVFLSGMDMFICDNFFNKPLDVALVIDPCRQDRGFFQWTGDPRERKRRVGGFYIIASRHRQAELEQFVEELEGGYTMRTDPNMRGNYGVSSGSGGPTIVNITEQRPGWMGQAIVGILFVQTLMLLMFAYVAISPRGAQQDDEAIAKLQQRERDVETRREVLDEVVKSMTDEKKVVSDLVKSKAEADALKDDLLVYKSGLPEIKEELAKTREKLKSVEADNAGLKKDFDIKSSNLKKAEARIKELEGDGESTPEEEKKWYSFLTTAQGISIMVVLFIFIGVVAAMAMKSYAAQDEFPREDFDDLPPEKDHMSHEDDGAYRMDDDAPPPEEPPADEPPRE